MKRVLIILIACLLLASCASKSVKKEGPGELYVEGVNLLKVKKWDDAIHKFNQVMEEYPFDPLALVAAVKLGDAHFDKKDYVMAAGVYETFIASHPEDDNAPYVLLKLGECYEHMSLSIDRDQANTLKAIEKYTLLKNRYPRSSYTKVVDDRLKGLEQKLADRELYVGEFYYRTNQYNASIVRLDYMLKKYPNAKGIDKALFYIAMSYKALANPEKADYYTAKLKADYPKSVYATSTIRQRKTLKVADSATQPIAKKRKRLNPEAIEAQASPAGAGAQTGAVVAQQSSPAAGPDSPPAAPGLQAAAEQTSGPKSKDAPPRAGGAAKPAAAAVNAASDAAKDVEAQEAADLAALQKPEPVIMEEDLITGPSVAVNTPPPKPAASMVAKAAKPPVQETKGKKPGEIELTPRMYQDRQAAAEPPKPGDAPGKAGEPEKTGAPAKAKEADKNKKKDLDFFDKTKPIDIVSDTMEGFDKEKYVVFKGNVIAKQEDLYIFADTIRAYLNEESNEIDKAYAKDHVKILKKERTATANEAIFDNRKGEITLKGNVIVFQGQDKLTGDVVTYYVNEDKAVVEGNKAEKGKRARVILTPK